jgi:hypothetical protein
MATNNDWQSATCGECGYILDLRNKPNNPFFICRLRNFKDAFMDTDPACPSFTPREEAKENG